MFLTEYNQAKVLEQERRDSLQQGVAQGIAQGITHGIEQANERVAADMIRDNYPLTAIHKISRLSEDAILKIASTLGITVVL